MCAVLPVAKATTVVMFPRHPSRSSAADYSVFLPTVSKGRLASIEIYIYIYIYVIQARQNLVAPFRQAHVAVSTIRKIIG